MSKPCLNCTRRYVGCHANCKDCDDMKAESRERYLARVSQRDADRVIRGYEIERNAKFKQAYNGRKSR